MSKTRTPIDRYVRVEADVRFRRDPLPTEKECDEIARSIRRHVDDMSRAFTVTEYEDQCSACGSKWTEDSDSYNGGCCDKDEENNPKTETP